MLDDPAESDPAWVEACHREQVEPAEKLDRQVGRATAPPARRACWTASKPSRSRITPNCRLFESQIPDIAAISGIFGRKVPALNGSNSVNEDFSGSFRQHDTKAAALGLLGRTPNVPFCPPLGRIGRWGGFAACAPASGVLDLARRAKGAGFSGFLPVRLRVGTNWRRTFGSEAGIGRIRNGHLGRSTATSGRSSSCWHFTND
jgi:hypothetical protein